MRELWTETWRSIVAHRVRFGLTSLGIAWGAFMLTYMNSTMSGFEAHFVHEFEELGPKLVFMGSGTILKDRSGERGARIVELAAANAARASSNSKRRTSSGPVSSRACRTCRHRSTSGRCRCVAAVS